MEMPGLDYLVAAMSRMGLFSLWVGQTPPVVNQATTVWLRPAQPSWSAEGVVLIWNAVSLQYEVATPDLWRTVLGSGIVPAALPTTLPATPGILWNNAGSVQIS